jgi:hypothetical protein
MTRRIFFCVSALFFAAAPLLAQDSGSKKAQNCSGNISADGQSFTCDKDKDHHVWKVSNPAVLTGMEGQYVKLTFKRTANADEVLVMSAAAAQQPTVAKNSGDSASPR